MIWSHPAASASSTPYWMMGLSTSGSISFGWALVAGRKRVPNPAAGKIALRTLRILRRSPFVRRSSIGFIAESIVNCSPLSLAHCFFARFQLFQQIVQRLQYAFGAINFYRELQRPVRSKLRTALRCHKARQLPRINRSIRAELDVYEFALALNSIGAHPHRLQLKRGVLQQVADRPRRLAVTINQLRAHVVQLRLRLHP